MLTRCLCLNARVLRAALACAGLGVVLSGPPAATAQTVGERAKDRGGLGETHMILNYSCSPEKRVEFREYMETKGVSQFEKWKKDGVMRNYLILFSSVVNEQLPDMWVILDFEKFVDVEKWQTVERDHPGGLSPEGLALAHPKTAVYADLGWQGGTPNADPTKSVWMLIPYVELVDSAKYEDFVNQYVIPQLKGWVKSGIMPSYNIYLDQNPTNAPWHSLLVFEYDGMRGIALRDNVKQSMRDTLQSDAGYRKYSPIKTSIRKELQPTTFYPILPKG